MSDDQMKDLSTHLKDVVSHAIKIREAADMLKSRLEQDTAEIDMLIDVLADAVRMKQAELEQNGLNQFTSLSAAGACMMMMYSLWHHIVADVDKDDIPEQFYLLRASFLALMTDMKYNEDREHVN